MDFDEKSIAALTFESLKVVKASLYWIDHEGQFVYVNDFGCMRHGYSKEEMLRLHVWEIDPNVEAEDFPGLKAAVMETPQEFETQHLTKNGDVYPVHVTTTYHRVDGHEIIVAYAHDLTEVKKAESEIQRLALYDALTSLPNRRLFYSRFEQAVSLARRHGKQLALFFVDLNDFKSINDRFGHLAGDGVLAETAARMQSSMRKEDILARIGGDEFVVLLGETDGEKGIMAVAHKLLDAIAEPFAVEGRGMNITGSIGIVLYPDHGEDIDTLMKLADNAMYEAKRAGGNTCCFTVPPGRKETP